MTFSASLSRRASTLTSRWRICCSSLAGRRDFPGSSGNSWLRHAVPRRVQLSHTASESERNEHRIFLRLPVCEKRVLVKHNGQGVVHAKACGSYEYAHSQQLRVPLRSFRLFASGPEGEGEDPLDDMLAAASVKDRRACELHSITGELPPLCRYWAGQPGGSATQYHNWRLTCAGCAAVSVRSRD